MICFVLEPCIYYTLGLSKSRFTLFNVLTAWKCLFEPLITAMLLRKYSICSLHDFRDVSYILKFTLNFDSHDYFYERRRKLKIDTS